MRSILRILLIIHCSLLITYAQWINIGTLSGTGQRPSVSMVDNNVIWFAGGTTGTPVLYRTTNGGANITSMPVPPCFDLTCLAAKSENECFVGDGGSAGGNGGNAKLYRTTNAGVNWTLVGQTNGTSGFFNDVVFSAFNLDDGIALSDPPNGSGQPFRILKTIDGGNNWTVENPPGISGVSSGVWHSVIIGDASIYGFSIPGGLNRVRLTSDGGSSWVTIPIFIPGNPITCFAYNDNVTAVLVGTPLVVARTTDSGLSWQTVNNGGAAAIRCVMGTSICYFVSQTVLKKSTDEGLTWNAMTTDGVNNLIHFDFSVNWNNIYGFAISTNGTVIKLADNVTGIHQVNENIPDKFKLHQNYPNPFNPATIIRLLIADYRLVTLKIYDALGKEITTLVNETLQPGTYEVNWNASNFSSGVYYYKLSSNKYSETRKMILLK